MTRELVQRRCLAAGVPTLQSAAFISPRRERTGVWGASPAPTGPSTPWRDIPRPPALKVHDVDAAPVPNLPVKVSSEASHDKMPASAVRTEPERTQHVAASLAPAAIGGGGTSQGIAYDLMLGVTDTSPQFGLLGAMVERLRWTLTRLTQLVCLESRAVEKATL